MSGPASEVTLEQASDVRAAYAGARVVVTGATGYVGARVTRQLVALGSEVTALRHEDGPDAWRLGSVAEQVRFESVDLTDATALRHTMRELNPRVVFHLATFYAVDNEADLAAMVDTNVKAAALLVSACRGLGSLRMLVNTGTCAEYGDYREPADESTRLDPNNSYASTKAAQTLIAMQLGRDLDVPVTTLRLYNLYGEYEKPSRLVPTVALALARGERVALTGGEQAKDYTYVGDVADAFVRAGAAPAAAGRIVNIGSGVTVTMRELVQTLAREYTGGEDLLDFGALPYRPDEMWYQGTHTDVAREVLGWQATTPLPEGMARIARWYREHGTDYDGA